MEGSKVIGLVTQAYPLFFVACPVKAFAYGPQVKHIFD
jgi:hypothetical protein